MKYSEMPPEHAEKERKRHAAYRAANKEKMKAHREAHKEEKRAYDVAYHKTHREKRRVLGAAYYKEHRKDFVVNARRYKLKFPARQIAKSRVHDALISGKLVRGSCERCGSKHDIHGHHSDYNKPLSVTWLCRTCHVELHYALRAEKR